MMNLSEQTISVLKNFATINQNLVIKKGKTLMTMSSMKNIIAKANIEENFPKEVAIYDLNEFLASLSLFKSPTLDFQDQYLTMNEGSNKIKYFYSDPSVVQSPSKMLTMPNPEVKFTINSSDLSKMKRAAGVINAPDMVLEKNGSGTFLTAKNAKNDTANTYSTDIVVEGDGTYKFYFKVENLKLMDGDYDVQISSQNISHFSGKNIEYFIALEPDSTYNK